MLGLHHGIHLVDALIPVAVLTADVGLAATASAAVQRPEQQCNDGYNATSSAPAQHSVQQCNGQCSRIAVSTTVPQPVQQLVPQPGRPQWPVQQSA